MFRRHEKEELLRVANLMALSGLATVALAISAAVVLVVSFVERGAPVVVIAAATFSSFVVLFALPLVRRRPPGDRGLLSAPSTACDAATEMSSPGIQHG